MNWFKDVLGNIGSAFVSFTQATGRTISLVPTYLSHLLYLISQEYLDLAKQGVGQNAAVYACLRFLTQAVAEPPLLAYTRQPDGDRGDALGYQHPLRRFLRSPNPFLTEYEHYELITMHLAINGRYTAWKERDNLGRPIAAWPLRPDRVGPIYGKASEGEPVLIGWSYLVPGTTRYVGIPAADVLLINFPDPSGESGGLVEGFGPLQALASEVGADNQATQFVGALLANHAAPLTVMQVQGKLTSADDARLIKAAFMADFSGSNLGTPAVIDQGTQITSLGFSLDQLEFPDLRKISESRIAAAFGVPAILVGLLVGLESGIKATTDELRALFTETTLANYWRRYEDAFTNQLAAEFGTDLVCKFDLTKVRALAQQAQAEVEQIATAYTNGAILIDEYREALGFEPLPNNHGQVLAFGIAAGTGMEALQEPATLAPTPPVPSAPAIPGQPVSADPVPPPADAPPQPPARSGALAQLVTLSDVPHPADVDAGADLIRSAFADIMEGLVGAGSQ